MSHPSNGRANEHRKKPTAADRHGLLASGRGRRILEVLADRSGMVELEDLATDVVARDADSNPVDQETVDRVAAALHHVHLPRMDEADVVDYDPKSRRLDPVRVGWIRDWMDRASRGTGQVPETTSR